ncbi:hypothetical protein GGR58DRAFT_327535 [Xylaria digitata]|nr:hypothetical protein GGR58DRAFT_327535 [Xylaria digitata]
MAKERATKKERARKKEKKISDDKVAKSGKEKKRAATTSEDEESSGGALVDAESSGDVSVVDSSNIEDSKSKGDKKAKKEKKGKQAVAETDDDTTDGGAVLFSADTNPTPVDLATIKTVGAEESNDGDGEESKPKRTRGPKTPNHAERRRKKLIARQKEIIMKEKGVSEGAEVQNALDKWTWSMDRKAAARLERKNIRKAKDQARLATKRSKARVPTGKEKELKKIQEEGGQENRRIRD